MRLYSNHKRPFHLDCLALEGLRRQPRPAVVAGGLPTDINVSSDEAVAHAIPEGYNMLVTHPGECIDCGVCEPECRPADAAEWSGGPGKFARYFSPEPGGAR